MADDPKPDTGSFDRAAKLGGAISRLKGDRANLKTQLDAANARIAELEKRPSADDVAAKLAEAQDKLRETNHKAAWKEAAAKAKLRPEAVDDAWGLSGYKAESDDVDPKAIEAALGKLKESKGYLFAEGEAKAEEPPPKLDKGAGSERGKAPADPVKVRVTLAQRNDPQWMRENQSRLAEAIQAGHCEFLP